MSSLGQSIRNNFPLWSKIRKDDSSIGAIILDNMGEELEDLRSEIIRRGIQKKSVAGSPVCEPSNLNVFYLSENSTFNNFVQDKEFLSFNAIAKIGALEIALISINSYLDLCKAFPTRISLEEQVSTYDYLIESLSTKRSSNTAYEFYKNPTRVYLNIYGSKTYETLFSNQNFSGKRMVVLRGTNIFGKRIEERIEINNDGLYKTNNIFRTLEPVEFDIEKRLRGGDSIEIYGFDGTVEVLKYPMQVTKKIFPLKLLVKKIDELNFNNSMEENNAYFEISNAESSSGEIKSTLKYIFHTQKGAESYLNEEIGTDKGFFEQVLFEQDLLQEDGSNTNIDDFDFDFVRNALVTIDNTGALSWYGLKKQIFSRPQYERTKKVNIVLEAERQQVVLSETIQLFISMERAKGNVSFVMIVRQRPSERKRDYDDTNTFITDFNFEYLQADFTWSKTVSFFSGRNEEDIYLNFNNKTIDVSFEEYGQHDFFVFSFANEFNSNGSLQKFRNGDITETEFKNHLVKFLEDEKQEIVLIDTYSIFCESQIPLYSTSTDIVTKIQDKGEDPLTYSLGMHFDGLNNDLFITASNDTNTYLYKLKEYKDYILFDFPTGNGAVLEEYDSVTVTINDELVEEVTYNG